MRSSYFFLFAAVAVTAITFSAASVHDMREVNLSADVKAIAMGMFVALVGFDCRTANCSVFVRQSCIVIDPCFATP